MTNEKDTINEMFREDIAEIKTDIKAIYGELKQLREKNNDEITACNEKISNLEKDKAYQNGVWKASIGIGSVIGAIVGGVITFIANAFISGHTK